MVSFDRISQQMRQAGIAPSVQRIKIMEYLLACQCHPTADQIYRGLAGGGLSISKATVYNTLALFSEKGLIRVLEMEDNENRYDIITRDHGHFICEQCGAIMDFDIEMEKIVSDALKDYSITQKAVYFKGVCSKCLKNDIKGGGTCG